MYRADHNEGLERITMKKDYEVFISYRHKDCNDLAKALHNEFLNIYGVDSFRDDEELHFGDFRTQLIRNNKRSQYLVLLLTPGMLDRCFEEGDWITTEISLYLEAGKPIIPIKMNGFEYPTQLPDKIKDLIKHDTNAIVCDFYNPEQTAKVIANGVYEQIRKGWSPKLRQEAIQNRQFLSKDNRKKSSYYYSSAVELRKCLFFMILQLIFALGISFLYFKSNSRDYGLLATLSVIPLALLYFEIFAVDGVTFDCLILDNPISEWITPILKAYFIGVIPMILIAFLLPLGAMIGGAIIGAPSEELYSLTIVVLFFYLPLVRWIYKSLLASFDFFNCIFGRYPKKFLVYKKIDNIYGISSIVGWVILLPSILFCGFVAALILRGMTV